MKICCIYLAQLRQAANRGSEEITLDGPATVYQALEKLAAKRPELAHWFLDAGKLSPTLLLFVGEHQVDATHYLADGAELTLLTPIAGGGSGHGVGKR